MWNQYQQIAAVSEACADSFIECFPGLKPKVVKIENLLAVASIRKRAVMKVPEELKKNHEIVLLSIGRFCTAKNFDNVPDICRRIIENGTDVIWYLIGFGSEEKRIRQKICENKMQQNVFILGKKENLPLYRFLKEPLIRKFGEAWYHELEEAAEELKKQGFL